MASKEALNAMGTWVAAIADNVKNPIASIDAVLNHIEGRLDEPLIVEAAISKIRERLGALNEYITELADFGRPAVVKPGPTDVRRLLADAVRVADLPESCSVDVVAPDGLQVEVDRTKLTLVLKALLLNAFEAVDNAQAPRLRLIASLHGDDRIAIAVEDNGPGLSSAAAKRAFKPFFSTKEAGTGLGLTIVRKYVEAHGGEVGIERSSVLGGCRVEMKLPGSMRSN